MTFYKSDCLEQMKKLASKSIDLIYWNPPFGTTRQKWDEKLNWTDIFTECFRILKNDGNLIIHCSIPFNYELIRKAPCPPTYSWYWDKGSPTLPLIVNYQPLRRVEEILVWKMKKTKYFPQRIGSEERLSGGGYTTNYANNAKKIETRVVKGYCQTHLITMKRKINGFSTRPDEMIELFIKSYTNKGDTVLDPTCYKGLTGKICKKMERKWIGIDKYFEPEKGIVDSESETESETETVPENTIEY